MKLRKKGIPPVRLEMTPLMDIVFLLLVFFIYSMLSMSVHHGKQIDLPQSSSVSLETREVLSITIEGGKDGMSVAVGGGAAFTDLYRLQELLARKKAEAKEGGEPDVQIFADKSVDYQNLFRVLDCVSKAGLSRISLQAQLERAAP